MDRVIPAQRWKRTDPVSGREQTLRVLANILNEVTCEDLVSGEIVTSSEAKMVNGSDGWEYLAPA